MTLVLKHINTSMMDQVYLHHFSTTIEPHRVHVVLGPTLGGKTSLLRAIAGLDALDSGQMTLNGRDITSLNVRQRHVAMVYQQFINYPHLSVFDNIASSLKMAKTSASLIHDKVMRISKQLELSKLLTRKPSELSGGQQQRVALARALVKDATIILMDEPLVNLDYKLREQLRNELRQLTQDLQKPFVYTTSDPQEALLFAGDVSVIYQGQCLQTGRALDVYHQPNQLTVAKLMNDPPINTLKITIQDHHIGIPESSQQSPKPDTWKSITPGDYTLAIRAHQIHLGKHTACDHISLSGPLLLTELTGTDCYLHTHAQDTDILIQTQLEKKPHNQQHLDFSFSLTDCFVFDQHGKTVYFPTRKYYGTH